MVVYASEGPTSCVLLLSMFLFNVHVFFLAPLPPFFLKPSFHCFYSFGCACILCRMSTWPLDVILFPLVTVYVASRCYITSFGYCLCGLSMLYYLLWLLSTWPLDGILLPLVTIYVSSRWYITSFGYCLRVLSMVYYFLWLLSMCPSLDHFVFFVDFSVYFALYFSFFFSLGLEHLIMNKSTPSSRQTQKQPETSAEVSRLN